MSQFISFSPYLCYQLRIHTLVSAYVRFFSYSLSLSLLVRVFFRSIFYGFVCLLRAVIRNHIDNLKNAIQIKTKHTPKRTLSLFKRRVVQWERESFSFVWSRTILYRWNDFKNRLQPNFPSQSGNKLLFYYCQNTFWIKSHRILMHIEFISLGIVRSTTQLFDTLVVCCSLFFRTEFSFATKTNRRKNYFWTRFFGVKRQLMH